MQTSKSFDEEAWKDVATRLGSDLQLRRFQNRVRPCKLISKVDSTPLRVWKLDLTHFLKLGIQRVPRPVRTNLEETIGRAALDEVRFEQEVLYYIERDGRERAYASHCTLLLP